MPKTVFGQPSCFFPQPLRGRKNPIPRWIVRPSRSGLDVQNPQFRISSTGVSDFEKTDVEGRVEARLLNATCASKLLVLQSLDRHPRCRREHPAKSSLQSPHNDQITNDGPSIRQRRLFGNATHSVQIDPANVPSILLPGRNGVTLEGGHELPASVSIRCSSSQALPSRAP